MVETLRRTLTAGSPAKMTVMRVKWKPEAQSPQGPAARVCPPETTPVAVVPLD